ncbi:hypothetical protein Rsub_06960 [Raphidocelis subcapitata]|uniref:Acid phosphatase n=1 Tax=Raphidocelis subcapitata TaxID=307507 RepID=A0A2V0P3A2_9CHLO|nr:hypothetical protein Rsub_06960 [Raphidocelis subcapitata]|eukprot:GBF94338.1 hypothetical protein Rsub_06960 [Raphidocelis subcapitata]
MPPRGAFMAIGLAAAAGSGLVWVGENRGAGRVAMRRAGPAPPAAVRSAAAAPTARPVLDNTTGRLRQLNVVFRHGARTPLTDETHLFLGHEWGADVCGAAYPGGARLKVLGIDGRPSPPSPEDEKQRACRLPGGACHKGELTRLGQQQARAALFALELGRWLRRRYCEALPLLPPAYAPGALSLHTTKFSRTRETLRGVLSGLYEFGPGSPEVPVVSSGETDALLFADSRHCPHLHKLMEASIAKLSAQEAAERESPQGRELRAALDAALGLPAGFWARRWSWAELHDAITSLSAHGKGLPAGLTDGMRREVDLLATRQFAAYCAPSLDDESGHAILRLSMSPLFDILLHNMRGVAGGGSNGGDGDRDGGGGGDAGRAQPKAFFYSGHDSTLLPILLALGVDIEANGWPPYLSNICIELWELHPPAPDQQQGQQQAQQQQKRQQQGQSGSPAYPTTDGSRFAVRVLFNKQELPLPDCPPDRLMGLATFESELLGSFLLGEQEHAQACCVSLEHDSPLPQLRMSALKNGAFATSEE